MDAKTITAGAQRRIPSGPNALKIATFLFFLAVSFGAAQALADFGWTYAAALSGPAVMLAKAATVAAVMALATVNAVVMLGMAVLAHEAVHRMLFRSRFWNECWGGLLSALALIPFHANRQFHLTHHAHAHQPGLDPENEMHDGSFLKAFFVGSTQGLYVQYRTWLKQLTGQSGRKGQARKALLDLIWVLVAGVLYFGLPPVFGVSPLVSSLPMILSFPLVFSFRALSDHYGVPAVQSLEKTRREILDPDDPWRPSERRVTGWVVRTHPFMEWVWSNVNYHEVHHKFPYLPHSQLRAAFEATREELPYLVVNGYIHSLLRLRTQRYYSQEEDVAPLLTCRPS